MTIDKSFNKGDIFNYTFNVIAGTKPGSYKEQINVRVNVTQASISCWQFSYIL